MGFFIKSAFVKPAFCVQYRLYFADEYSVAVLVELSSLSFLPLLTGKLATPLFALPLSDTTKAQLATVSWEAVFLVGTAVLGLLITYQAMALKRHDGKLPETSLFSIASLTETIWSMVAAGVLYWGNFATLPKVIAVAYVLYAIFGWGYSFYLLKDEDLDIDNIDDIQMPAKYMDYTLAFAIVITLSSVAFLAQLWFMGRIASWF